MFNFQRGHWRSLAWRLGALGARGEGLRWPVGCAAVAAKGAFHDGGPERRRPFVHLRVEAHWRR